MCPDRFSSKIKIVRVIARLNIGGPALQAISLTKELNGDQFFSRLVTGRVSPGEEDLTSFASEQGIKPIFLSKLSREIGGMRDVLAFCELVKILKNLQPHIVHTHTAKAGTLGRLAAVYARVPIRIHTFHGHIFEGYFGPIKTKLFIWIERFLALMTDRILVLCESQQKDLVEKYHIAPKAKFQIIPLGFNLTSFSPYPGTNSIEQKENPIIIGFVGRLVAIKNPSMLLKAFHSVVGSYGKIAAANSSVSPKLNVWFIGSGPLENSLFQEAQDLELNSKVTFWGWQRDLPRFYQEMDFMVLTSLNEGTPVALIEAMVSQKAFIATDVGGMRDLMVGKGEVVRSEKGEIFTVFDNGILVKCDDVEGLSAAISYLVDHPQQRIEMGKVGEIFSRAHFSQERLVSDIQALYRDLMEKKVAC